MATSAPAPMAMPMSARVRAGASLMPSPTMATLPRCISSTDGALLALRQHPGDDLIHPGLGADGLGGALVVAGEHDHVDAHILQLPDRPGAVLLDDVRHGDHAQRAGRPRRRTAGVLPCRASSSA